jgi:stage II sporulation protein AA (anti-sigma F factor antagonist)
MEVVVLLKRCLSGRFLRGRLYQRGLTMKTEIQGTVLSVALAGELDHHSATDIRDKLDSTYERSGCRHIVFDFTEVSFMDSSGIGMLMGRYKNAEKRGGKVAVATMNSQLSRLFALSGLQKIIGQYPSVKAARQGLCGETAAGDSESTFIMKGGAESGN